MSPWRDMVFSGRFAVVERLCGGEWRCRCRMTFQCIAKGRGKSRGRDRKIPGKIKHVITPLRRRRTTPRDYVPHETVQQKKQLQSTHCASERSGPMVHGWSSVVASLTSSSPTRHPQ